MTPTLTLERYKATLWHDRVALEALRGWLESCPDPLRAEAVKLELLDETGTRFKVTHYVRDHDNRWLIEDDEMVHAVTVVTTPVPLPLVALKYFEAKSNAT